MSMFEVQSKGSLPGNGQYAALPFDELKLRLSTYYNAPATLPAHYFIRQGVIFTGKLAIPVFIAKDVKDEQYHEAADGARH